MSSDDTRDRIDGHGIGLLGIRRYWHDWDELA